MFGLRISFLVVIFCQGCQATKLYTVHYTPKSWNEAREICAHNGGRLMSITSENDWYLWIALLNTTGYPNTADILTYWFGLHARETTSTNGSAYVWDPCEQPAYTIPLVEDAQSNYPCVLMWIHREIVPGQLIDRWFKGRQCNLSYPFVCEHEGNAMYCIPSCNKTVVTSDPVSCNNWCLTGNCTSNFIQQTNYCHIQPATYSNEPFYTICLVPEIGHSLNICTSRPDVYANYTDFIDPNVNISRNLCNINRTTTGQPPVPTTTAVTLPTTTSTFTSTVTAQVPTDLNVPLTTPVKTTDTTCMCSCEKLQTFLATPEPDVAKLTIEEKVEIIVAELTVDKKNTTASQRKLISVLDYRPTSVGIGSVAAIIIFAVMGIIVIIDISRIWHEIRYILFKFKLIIKGYKMGYRNPVSALVECTSRFNISLAAPSYVNANSKKRPLHVGGLFSCTSFPIKKAPIPGGTTIPRLTINQGTNEEVDINRANSEYIAMDSLTLVDVANEECKDQLVDIKGSNEAMEDVNFTKQMPDSKYSKEVTTKGVNQKKVNQEKTSNIRPTWKYWK